jgi:hypothetical protein
VWPNIDKFEPKTLLPSLFLLLSTLASCPPFNSDFCLKSQETPCLAFNSRYQDLSVEISLSSQSHSFVQSRSPDLSLKIFLFFFSILSSFFFHIQWKSLDLGFLSSQPIHSFPFSQSL